jgi:NitT/TauT family transport system substrate-binding protein
MNAKIKNFVVVFLAAMLLVACAQPTPQVVEKIVEKTVVVTPVPAKLTTVNVPLGWLNNDEFVGLQVAQAKGFYANVGLNVNLISGGGSTGFDPIIAVNGFDDVIRIGVPAALSLVLKAYSQGINIVAVAALTQYEPAGFLFMTKNGLKTAGPCDFKGKVVAMQMEAFWYVDALGAMCPEESGGPLKASKDFTLVPAGYTPACLTAAEEVTDKSDLKILDKYRCDFYCGWSTNQPFMLEQQGLKAGTDYGFFLASDFLPFYFGDVIVTTKTYAKAHPAVVKAFVQASMKGLQYTLDNPNDAIAIGSLVPGIDPAHVTWRIPLQNSLATNEDTVKHGIGYMDLVKVQAMIDFLFANGQIPNSFKAEEVVDNSFLSAP